MLHRKYQFGGSQPSHYFVYEIYFFIFLILTFKQSIKK